jgi:hypothetical protein
MWLLLFGHGQLPAVDGNYLAAPEFMWSIPIVASTADQNDPNTIPIFQKGNAIVPLNDYGVLAITSSTGTLHIIYASDVTVGNSTTGIDTVTNTTGFTKSYTPTNISTNLDTITCQGGIITSFQNTDGSFTVLYAITGTDSTAQFPPMSRLLAINTATTTLVWNITIPGTIVGTPLLSPNLNYLYVVHNVALSDTQAATDTSFGQVSIFQFNVNSNIFAGSNNRMPRLVSMLPSTPTDQPFGPATIATDPLDGRDYLFFVESSEDSFSEAFTDALFAVTENDDNEFLFILATLGVSSTNTAPTIRINNNDQFDFFLGQPESKMFGWVGDAAQTLFAGLTSGEDGSNSVFVIPSWQIESSKDREDEAIRTFHFFIEAIL